MSADFVPLLEAFDSDITSSTDADTNWNETCNMESICLSAFSNYIVINLEHSLSLLLKPFVHCMLHT